MQTIFRGFFYLSNIQYWEPLYLFFICWSAAQCEIQFDRHIFTVLRSLYRYGYGITGCIVL